MDAEYAKKMLDGVAGALVRNGGVDVRFIISTEEQARWMTRFLFGPEPEGRPEIHFCIDAAPAEDSGQVVNNDCLERRV